MRLSQTFKLCTAILAIGAGFAAAAPAAVALCVAGAEIAPLAVPVVIGGLALGGIGAYAALKI